MSPVARRPLHLGFIGLGSTSTKNITALLGDLIESNGGKAKVILPATKAHWTEGIEAVADFALENSIPLALITDDTTLEHKALKSYISQASEKVKAANVATKLVDTVANGGNGKLVMLWDDEDDDCYTALERAESKDIEALDLTAGLHKLEFSGGAAAAEPEPEEDAEPEPDYLDEMDEDALQAKADELEIDVTSLDTWDDVRNAIREVEGDAEDAGQDDLAMAAPSADEVLEWDFPTLKEFATANDIEVPPRSRTSGYREAITAWLNSSPEAAEGEDGDLELPADDDELPVEIGEFDFSGVTEPLMEEIGALRIDIQSLAGVVAELAGTLTDMNTRMKPAPAPAKPPATTTKAVSRPAPAKAVAKAPQKAASAVKKAPAKRPVARPAAKAAPAEKAAERPLDSFMHLLGKKLTRAQAREIMIANQSKGRGRPTEDERRLVNQAKEIVPQV